MKPHWQPKDRKEDMAQDIREWIQVHDPSAKMESLSHMTARDLTDLMLALRDADRLFLDAVLSKKTEVKP